MRIRALRQKFILSLLLGMAVVLGLTIYGDAPALLATLRAFQWDLLPAVLVLTLFNYALRFVKWHYYLGQIGAEARLGDSFAIFTSGLSMAMTPGKIGEVLKPVLLRFRTGTPVSRSVPVIVAERLTDGVAMVILALGGLLLSHQDWQVLLASILFAAALLGLLGSRRGGRFVTRICNHLPYVGSRITQVEDFLSSSRALFTPRNLVLAVGIGVVSWSGEAVAFFLVLLGLGLHASATLLVQATFVLAASTLVGSLSMLPGGLGATDASVTGLLLLTARLSRAKAAAATLLIRFSTLWFGVVIGLLALWVFRRRFGGVDAAAREDEVPLPSPLTSQSP